MKEIKIKVDDEQAKLIKEGKLTFALVETEAIEDAKKAEDADGGVVLITTKAKAAEKVDSGSRPPLPYTEPEETSSGLVPRDTGVTYVAAEAASGATQKKEAFVAAATPVEAGASRIVRPSDIEDDSAVMGGLAMFGSNSELYILNDFEVQEI